MTSIPANLQAVRDRIERAVGAAARPAGSVGLVAVSKTWPVARVAEAAAAGQRAFGENYVQEGVDKIRALAELGLEWHFIGPLQSNKSRLVAAHFDWVHSIDRAQLAERLSSQRPAGRAPLNVCIQVNVSGEASKHGVAPDEVGPLARAVGGLSGLRLRGLMCIPEPDGGEVLLRARFRMLGEMGSALRGQGFALDTLSMGMSQDLELAIAEGSTLVRVGRAIFGSRTVLERTLERD